jgi:hypothetical protein
MLDYFAERSDKGECQLLEIAERQGSRQYSAKTRQLLSRVRIERLQARQSHLGA